MTSDWTQYPLSALARPLTNSIDPTTVPQATYIGLEHIEPHTGRVVATGKAREVRSAKNRFIRGNLLYGKLRPYLNKVAIAESDGVASTDLIVLEATPLVRSDYLAQLMRTPPFVGLANHLAGGVELPRVRWGRLSEVSLPIPTIDEQDEILRSLTALREGALRAGAHIESARSDLQSFRSAALSEATDGRLTEGWRSVQPEPASDWLDEYLKPVSMRQRGTIPGAGDEVEERLPSGWRRVQLGRIFDVATGGTPLKSNRAFYDGGDIPWVTSGAVNAALVTQPSAYITEAALEQTSAKKFPIGTLLVAMYGEGQTRGRTSELGIEAATNQAVAAILFEERNERLKAYLKILLDETYRHMRTLSAGGVQANLSLRIIKEMPLLLPPPAEQDEIVRRVGRLSESVARASGSVDSAAVVLASTLRASAARLMRADRAYDAGDRSA